MSAILQVRVRESEAISKADPETLHTTDPQEHMTGPISNWMQRAKKKAIPSKISTAFVADASIVIEPRDKISRNPTKAKSQAMINNVTKQKPCAAAHTDDDVKVLPEMSL